MTQVQVVEFIGAVAAATVILLAFFGWLVSGPIDTYGEDWSDDE